MALWFKDVFLTDCDMQKKENNKAKEINQLFCLSQAAYAKSKKHHLAMSLNR